MISGFVDKGTEQEKMKDGPGKALSIAAYPIAAVSGAFVFRDQILEESYASHDRKKGFEDIREKRLARYKEIQNDKSLAPEQKWEQIGLNNKDFTAKSNAKLEDMGYTNVFKHAGTVSPLARNNAIIAGFTVAGITLGSLLLISNGPNIWKELFGDGNKDKNQGR